MTMVKGSGLSNPKMAAATAEFFVTMMKNDAVCSGFIEQFGNEKLLKLLHPKKYCTEIELAEYGDDTGPEDAFAFYDENEVGIMKFGSVRRSRIPIPRQHVIIPYEKAEAAILRGIAKKNNK